MFKQCLYEFSELKQITNETGRKYVLPTGESYPSVTTVLGAMDPDKKAGLKRWEDNIGKEEADKITKAAAKRGSLMHNMCENYLLNKPIPEDDHPFNLNKEMFLSLKPIIDKNVDEVYGVEFPLYSHRLKTAGMCDFFCLWEGKKTILDFKTSGRQKKEEWIQNYFTQETVYAMCLWETYNIKVDQIITLIAVEHDRPQIFVKDPLDYVQRAVKIFKDYHSGIRA